MSAPWIVLLALAGAALLALGHHAFWTWRLGAPAREDARLAARTGDGWELALGRRLPRGPARRPPVLLCHGLSANRWMLDPGLPDRSLSAFLAGAGFDCFAVDLRGHGGSRRGPLRAGRWSFDTYLSEDVPAALDAVRGATGQERVLWVGHSLGALLGMAACEVHGGRMAGLVAIAGPVLMPAFRGAVHLLLPAGGRWNRFLAAMTAPLAGALPLPLVEGIVARDNVDRPAYRRLMANGIEDVPPGVYAQLRDWVREQAFRSADGALDYRAGLASCRQPALFVGAPLDRLASPAAARAGYERWGGPRELFLAGRGAGLSADYSHTDLLLGRRATEEVFPRIRDWLLAHSEPR
ncbi:MAG TPA: alpha/beta fold hydrolase [Anaeromyxobacteraceae bacterium]|nr:alpha/beta fold hydrolase [Anaeromyxobacteraceae bacterium]